MARAWFTIGGGMALVALSALVFAALTRPTALVGDGVFTLAVGSGFAAIVAAIAMTGRARSASASFAVCGLGYLALVLGPYAAQEIGPHLLQSHLVALGAGSLDTSLDVGLVWAAHSLLGIASGMAGGLLALGLAPRSGPPNRPPINTTGDP